MVREKITPLHCLLIHEQEVEGKGERRYMYRDKTRNMVVKLEVKYMCKKARQNDINA